MKIHSLFLHHLLQHYTLAQRRKMDKNNLPIESLATLLTHMSLLARVNDKVKCQLLFPLERLHTHCTHKRPLWVVGLLVPRQVVLALEACAANVAEKAALHCMTWLGDN